MTCTNLADDLLEGVDQIAEFLGSDHDKSSIC